MTEIAEMLESIQISNSITKGYKYTCANTPLPCEECGGKLVSFITQDLEEAYQHSKRNNTAMWISKD